MTLQADIDAIDYPPTHTYNLKGLTPTGSLAERVEVIEREFPEFFEGGVLLDVGCNKGFFSLYHRGKVIGIDPDEKCVELCRKLRHDGEFQVKSFGEFTSTQLFNRIFIGNGHHYPFIESGGWYFLEKLGNLTIEGGLVLIEGPIDMEGVDAQRCIPDHLAGEFTAQKLLEAFAPRFYLVKMVPSPLVNRSFLMFRRRNGTHTYSLYLESLYRAMAERTKPTDTVMEICTREDRGVLSPPIIPHEKYVLVDRDFKRPGHNLDAISDPLPECDVALSTAVFHHTDPKDIEALFINIARNTTRTIMITGPADDMGSGIYGDHLYHLNADELGAIAKRNGWRLSYFHRIGIKYCVAHEWFLVFERVAP